MALLGNGALALALALYVYAAVVGAWSAARASQRLQRSARNALLAALPATATATTALVVAFVRHDFSLVYVAQHSSLALPLAYRVSALWGGQEGSLLLWLLILATVAFGAVVLNRRLLDRTLPWAVPVLAAIGHCDGGAATGDVAQAEAKRCVVRVAARRADDEAGQRNDAALGVQLARAQRRRGVAGDARVEQEHGEQRRHGQRHHQTHVTVRFHSHPPSHPLKRR